MALSKENDKRKPKNTLQHADCSRRPVKIHFDGVSSSAASGLGLSNPPTGKSGNRSSIRAGRCTEGRANLSYLQVYLGTLITCSWLVPACPVVYACACPLTLENYRYSGGWARTKIQSHPLSDLSVLGAAWVQAELNPVVETIEEYYGESELVPKFRLIVSYTA
ncbi:hypothetical protein PoMZ_10716 [Pyricularia oryzae]|uniref:Uncharacterized protein n=1 Tax=Pyricularia oryzae TaxID=318829 RepID=A0A4P7N4V6_PYROR|nr:hypothetical protein PoMZ_10716 [Pyricularia oryzae]